MSHDDLRSAARPEPDTLLQQLADYTLATDGITSEEAIHTARLCLLDGLGCALLALSYPACVKLLGPTVPGADMSGRGARVPGTSFELDPVQAAFDIGTMVRWLDFNDTWLAAEWGHPSDNLGAILAVADFVSRNAQAGRQRSAAFRQQNHGKCEDAGISRSASPSNALQPKGRAPLPPGAPGTWWPLTVRDVLIAMIQAYEIQGILALENGFNRLGLDHVLLVRIASTAVATRLLGGTREQIINALSNAFLDGGALRTYRHAPNTGSRKSWAAGDATSRAVRHALFALKGEMGYPSALTAKTWGFQDVVLRGQTVRVPAQGFGSYVMENILFKISFPAEFHAQTAVEAALRLHPQVINRLDQLERIRIETQESGKRIIDKTGPLNNPADRDHCLQYMVAVPLLRGSLTAEDYEDKAAADPRIDALRAKMEVVENTGFSRDYLDPSRRSIANAVQVFLRDGTATERVVVEYPIGHRRRRKEGLPLLLAKFEKNLCGTLPPKQAEVVMALCSQPAQLEQTTVDRFMDLFSARS